MNKKQVEALIDKLADKTLSFGCRVRQKTNKTDYLSVVKGMTGVVINKGTSKHIKLVQYDNMTRELLYNCVVENHEILGHPILIGDILAKLTSEQYYQYQLLCELWHRCGFTKSLQEIVEESGWEICCIDGLEYCGVPSHKTERLKDPNARELLEFINKLSP